MIKTKCFNQKQFANNIIKLLNDKKIYNKTKNDALRLIKEVWLWPKRSKNIYESIAL